MQAASRKQKKIGRNLRALRSLEIVSPSRPRKKEANIAHGQGELALLDDSVPSADPCQGLITWPSPALFAHLVQSFPGEFCSSAAEGPGSGSQRLMMFSVWRSREPSSNNRFKVGELKDFPGKEIGKEIPKLHSDISKD